MFQITVSDLLSLPTRPSTGYPGAGTEIQLPDRISTMTVGSWHDHRWRSWRGTTIDLWVTLAGPALHLEAPEIFRQIPGCCSIARPLNWPNGRILGFHQDTALTVTAALPHSCDAEPGRPCHPPARRGVCTASSPTPVNLRAVG